MRQLRQTWKGLLMALIATSGILIACQKDARNPSVTSAAQSCPDCVTINESSIPTTPIVDCEDETGANSGHFSIKVEQKSATQFCVVILRDGLRPGASGQPAQFSRVEYVIKKGNNVVAEGNSGPEDGSQGLKTKYEFCFDNAIACQTYSLNITVKGMEGFNGQTQEVCLNQAPGASFNQGIFETTFDYTLAPLCEDGGVGGGCITQGGVVNMKEDPFKAYWNQVSPAIGNFPALNMGVQNDPATLKNYITDGVHNYTRDEIRAIFYLACNNPYKLGVQQLAAINVSIANNQLTTIPDDVASWVRIINSYLILKPKLTTSNACDSRIFPSKNKKDKPLQDAVGKLGNWLSTNSCTATPI